jgi:hypothetical protein
MSGLPPTRLDSFYFHSFILYNHASRFLHFSLGLADWLKTDQMARISNLNHHCSLKIITVPLARYLFWNSFLSTQRFRIRCRREQKRMDQTSVIVTFFQHPVTVACDPNWGHVVQCQYAILSCSMQNLWTLTLRNVRSEQNRTQTIYICSNGRSGSANETITEAREKPYWVFSRLLLHWEPKLTSWETV